MLPPRETQLKIISPQSMLDRTVLYCIMYGMPQVTVFIRDIDLPAWKKIDKKSAWMHEHLTGAAQEIVKMDKLIAKPKDVEKMVANLPKSDPAPEVKGKLCVHGNIKGKCLFKGCPFNTRF